MILKGEKEPIVHFMSEAPLVVYVCARCFRRLSFFAWFDSRSARLALESVSLRLRFLRVLLSTQKQDKCCTMRACYAKIGFKHPLIPADRLRIKRPAFLLPSSNSLSPLFRLTNYLLHLQMSRTLAMSSTTM